MIQKANQIFIPQLRTSIPLPMTPTPKTRTAVIVSGKPVSNGSGQKQTSLATGAKEKY
jgi:hypothetical protein